MIRHRFNIFPEAGDEDFARLVADIEANGFDDSLPITIYEGAVLDGWNRYRACQQIGIQAPTKQFAGSDADAFAYTVRTNKRRNLTSSQWAAVAVDAAPLMDEIAAKVEEQRRAKQAATLQATHEAGDFGKGVSDNLLSETKPDEHASKAASIAADAFNTNRTYINEAKKLKAINPWAFERVKTGQQSLGQAKTVHVSNNSGENEWYTPADYIALAREVMGGIDTDPASSEIANRTVQAARIYTADSNGLAQQWSGRVFLNPPYAQPLIAEFADAVASKFESGEIEQACVLVNNGTETAWFQRLLEAAKAVCFPRSRIRFIDAQGKAALTPLQGQAVLYMGENVEAFKRVFTSKGAVLLNV